MLMKTPAVLAAAVCALAAAPGWTATAPDAAADEKKASAYRERAAAGDADAALQLGIMISRRAVSAQRYGVAAGWYRKGCELGSMSACHNAAVCYEYGSNGVQRDDFEAATHYLKAAERAFLPSQFNLAVLHASGRITSQDHREGLKWMLIAQKNAAQCTQAPVCKLILGDRQGHRRRLEARLSEREIAETRALAEAWQPAQR